MALDVNVSRLETSREHALVAQARTDAGAFGRLYDEYLPRIYGFIARRTEDRAAAEELTAAAFRRALGAVRNDDLSGTAFGGFLYRVAASAVVDQVRRARRPVPAGVRASDLDQGDDRRVAEAIGSEAASRAFAAAVDRDVLRRALQAIPEGSRRVLMLRYFDGLEVDEACAALNSARPALAVRLHRALRILRGALEQESVDATTDTRVHIGEPTDGHDIPIAADLRRLDAELAESGARARQMLHGRTQPTNYFAIDLRARLLGAYSSDERAGTATLDVTVPQSQTPALRPFPEPGRGQTTLMPPLTPRLVLGAPSLVVSARWAFLAAAATGLLIAGAFGSGAIPR